MNFKKYLAPLQNLFFYFVLERSFADSKTVLDVGCGHSSALGKIKRNFRSEGIDIHKKTILLSKKRKNHDTYKLGDIRKLSKIYKKNSFDVCFSTDVIEHFTKKDALKLIKDMEWVAKRKVIILTPNGFLEQHDFDGNPHQVHKSGWSKNDLERLGYSVYGLRGLKYLRDDHATIRFRPWLFWGLCSFISEIICFYMPSLSFDLFAIKNLSKK